MKGMKRTPRADRLDIYAILFFTLCLAKPPCIACSAC